MQSLGDVVSEVGDGIDDGGLLAGSGVILLHQVVLQRDEVQRVAGDAAAVDLQSDAVVYQDHQTPEREEDDAGESVCAHSQHCGQTCGGVSWTEVRGQRAWRKSLMIILRRLQVAGERRATYPI